ncbi:class I SAM-dependent methyltransferase [Geomicrobium sp. JSM 1781026]|uniref:class I SAM-dependent methyltransferase n=1 Tax=Geomicrobium sp. JSM 1781026 TaxID=3344580 RepID=UPI0035BF3181
MTQKLIRGLQLPTPFEKSEKMFWQDPHIALFLLEAHLEPSHDGASRSFAFIDESVEFITGKLVNNDSAKIIDYGSGPGLYCERLAKKGLRVTGVDFSLNSINYARGQAENQQLPIEYRFENYLETDEVDRYDAALLIYCDLGALSQPDRQTLLTNIRKSLKPGGRLLLDVFTEHQYHAFAETRTWRTHENGGFWSPEPYVELVQNVKYSGKITLEQTTVITDDHVETYNIWHQYFTEEQLVQELEEAGFSIENCYEDVRGRERSVNSKTIAVIARRELE